MNYLKRRFSSGDLQNEQDDMMTIPRSNESHMNPSVYTGNINRQAGWEPKSSTYTSAPSSPTRSLSFANQFMTVARGVVNQAIQQIPHQNTGTGLSSSPLTSISHHSHPHHSRSISNKDQQHQHISKEKCKLLLVIDDQHTDW